MELVRYSSAGDFYRRTEPFLLAREAEHNLILGLAAAMMRRPDSEEDRPYFASVERGGKVVTAALLTGINLVLSDVEEPEAIGLLTSDLFTGHKMLPGVAASAPFGEAFAAQWYTVSGQTPRLDMAQRIYQLEQVIPVAGVPGSIRRAVPADRDLVYNWLVAFQGEALADNNPSCLECRVDGFLSSDTQGIYIWEDGQPVSMAGYSRPTANGVCVSAVYTPPEHRRKGYASACTAELSRILLDQGRKYCFLYTDLANPTSNHIYQAMGYTPVCDAERYIFDGPAEQSPGGGSNQ